MYKIKSYIISIFFIIFLSLLILSVYGYTKSSNNPTNIIKYEIKKDDRGLPYVGINI